jgi:NodT family efflux transporter outer membrane factor (OMF) lipoprotein
MKPAMLITVFALSGCALGADYVQPLFDFSSVWKEAPVASVVPANPKVEIDKEWWKNFDDPALNDLITKALINNLDVKIALARIKEARATRLGVIANQLPEMDASGNAGRIKNSQNTFSFGGGKPYNAFSVGFDASWEADIFGGRRAIEAADSTFESVQESEHDVEVTLLGDVASQYVAVRNYQNQIQVAEDNLKAQRDTLSLTQSRKQGGLLSSIDVTQAEALVQTTESNIPTLRASMRQSLHSLEILLGEQPGALENIVTQIYPVPISVHEVVMGAPADVLRNRPDIRVAERQLAAATAVQGVALSEMYPKISLTSLLGLGSSQTSNLLTGSSKTWSLGAGAILPIFDFGRIRSDIDVSNAQQEEAFLNYQKTVLGALEEVENALVAYNQ